jgi:amino acid transporter
LDFSKYHFGNAGRQIIAVITITTTAFFINTVLATLPKMFYGMAHHRQLPAAFMKIHSKFKSPWVGILFIATSIAIPLLLLSKAKDVLIIVVISSATIWLLTYIIAHINVMVLRKKYPHFNKPYKTPHYPVPQIIGIAGMVFAIIKMHLLMSLLQKYIPILSSLLALQLRTLFFGYDTK